MRAQCSVCQELFGDSDTIVAPQCGHTFHNTCIDQWLGTKKSCPTCRQSTASNKLVRIFFDIAFCAEVDSADLQQKLDETTLELQVAQREVRETRQENVTLKKKANKYCKEKKEAEEKVRDAEIITCNLQQRIDFLNKQVKNFLIIEDELKACKDKLKLMENVQQIVNATHQEVEEMLEQYGDRSETAKSLSTQCVILSRELNSKVALKQKAEEDLRKCRRQLSSLRVELQQVKKELQEKEDHSVLAEEDIKRYVAENSKLLEKLKTLQDSISSPSGDPRNSALSRLLHESPAPSHFRLSNLVASPCTPSQPFLQPKKPINVSSMRPILSDPQEEENKQRNKEVRKAEVSETEPEAIKFKRMKIDSSLPSSSSGFFYDGLGGHSKPDVYPQPSGSSRGRLEASSKSLFKARPVTIKTKGKTQKTTLDYFYSQ